MIGLIAYWILIVFMLLYGYWRHKRGEKYLATAALLYGAVGFFLGIIITVMATVGPPAFH